MGLFGKGDRPGKRGRKSSQPKEEAKTPNRDSSQENHPEETAAEQKRRKDARERLKHSIPDSCKLEMLKLNRIEKLDMDYVLVAHPFPQLEGEMLLF